MKYFCTLPALCTFDGHPVTGYSNNFRILGKDTIYVVGYPPYHDNDPSLWWDYPMWLVHVVPYWKSRHYCAKFWATCPCTFSLLKRRPLPGLSPTIFNLLSACICQYIVTLKVISYFLYIRNLIVSPYLLFISNLSVSTYFLGIRTLEVKYNNFIWIFSLVICDNWKIKLVLKKYM